MYGNFRNEPIRVLKLKIEGLMIFCKVEVTFIQFYTIYLFSTAKVKIGFVKKSLIKRTKKQFVKNEFLISQFFISFITKQAEVLNTFASSIPSNISEPQQR